MGEKTGGERRQGEWGIKGKWEEGDEQRQTETAECQRMVAKLLPKKPTIRAADTLILIPKRSKDEQGL